MKARQAELREMVPKSPTTSTSMETIVTCIDTQLMELEERLLQRSVQIESQANALETLRNTGKILDSLRQWLEWVTDLTTKDIHPPTLETIELMYRQLKVSKI